MWLKAKFLNLFESHSGDSLVERREQHTTRLYLFLISILFAVLFSYTAFSEKTVTYTVQKPSPRMKTKSSVPAPVSPFLSNHSLRLRQPTIRYAPASSCRTRSFLKCSHCAMQTCNSAILDSSAEPTLQEFKRSAHSVELSSTFQSATCTRMRFSMPSFSPSRPFTT